MLLAIIYSLHPTTGTVATLYRVPLTGPAKASIPLNNQIIGDRYIIYRGGLTIEVTPNNQYAIYKAGQTKLGDADLYSAPLNGPISATVKLSTAQIPGGGVRDYLISKDSQWVVYTADQENDEVFELYRSPVAGPANRRVKLNLPLATDYDVTDFLLTPDRQWVIYKTRYYSTTTSAKPDQIYVVPMNGSTSDTISLTDGKGLPYHFAVTPNSRKIVYLYAQSEAHLFELYATDLPVAAIQDRLFLPTIQQ